MASKKKPSAPLTFDLSMGLLRKIEDYRRKAGIKSNSEVIRDAIEMYDYGEFSPKAEPHRQISVRLPVGQKRELTRLAKQKKVSLGELLRVALKALPDDPEKKEQNGEPAPATRKATTRKTTTRKTAAKRAPAKKASEKAKAPAKRAPAKAKRTATKATPTRAAAKEATTRKATTKKAPARKTAARKTPSPRATSRTTTRKTKKK